MLDYNNPDTLTRLANPYLPKSDRDRRWRPDTGARALHRFVAGRPAPQGSKNYLPNGSGRESSKYLPGWRADVREAVSTSAIHLRQGPAPMMRIEGPAYVELEFVLARPKNEPKNRPTRPHLGRPDVDKLARGVLDALTAAGVLDDDAQVVDLRSRKRYAEPDEPTGCRVTVGPCDLESPHQIGTDQ